MLRPVTSLKNTDLKCIDFLHKSVIFIPKLSYLKNKSDRFSHIQPRTCQLWSKNSGKCNLWCRGLRINSALLLNLASVYSFQLCNWVFSLQIPAAVRVSFSFLLMIPICTIQQIALNLLWGKRAEMECIRAALLRPQLPKWFQRTTKLNKLSFCGFEKAGFGNWNNFQN